MVLGRFFVFVCSVRFLVVFSYRFGNILVGDKFVGFKGISSMRCGGRVEGRSDFELVE